MKIDHAGIEVRCMMPYETALELTENIGRVCYKSKGIETEDPSLKREHSEAFVSRLIKSGHESVLEHVSVTLCIICDRGCSHEIVRHRIASYTQESTRYCNYSKDRFGNEITVIPPSGLNREEYELWRKAMLAAEDAYFSMINEGIKPEIARSVLPMSLKTELIVTMNMREWRHFIRLRMAKDAHPMIREIAGDVYALFKSMYSVYMTGL